MTAGAGNVKLWIDTLEADVLEMLLDFMRAMAEDPTVAGPDVAARLDVVAYPDDPVLDEEFHRLVVDDLRRIRGEGVASIAAALADRTEDEPVEVTLTADDIERWMAAINAARLALAVAMEGLSVGRGLLDADIGGYEDVSPGHVGPDLDAGAPDPTTGHHAERSSPSGGELEPAEFAYEFLSHLIGELTVHAEQGLDDVPDDDLTPYERDELAMLRHVAYGAHGTRGHPAD